MYIIAEHVVEGHWENHYDIDPSETGLHPVYSVHRSIEGRNVLPFYTVEQFNEAMEDCALLNKAYPHKGYGVVRSL